MLISLHTSHPDIVKRLKRTGDRLRGIIEMIEAGVPTSDSDPENYAGWNVSVVSLRSAGSALSAT